MTVPDVGGFTVMSEAGNVRKMISGVQDTLVAVTVEETVAVTMVVLLSVAVEVAVPVDEVDVVAVAVGVTVADAVDVVVLDVVSIDASFTVVTLSGEWLHATIADNNVNIVTASLLFIERFSIVHTPDKAALRLLLFHRTFRNFLMKSTPIVHH
jgi:hypothetical protein